MFYKKILILTLICSLIPFTSFAAKKSKKATDDEMGSYEELAEKKASEAKIKKYKYAWFPKKLKIKLLNKMKNL